ncbi:hypothetical protein PUN28_000304 [Cardiocondyla obscurior]|uniref:C2H2-type domain-containing protein n=2 Tax=Cardiocondyla obscurior TaxID=286306 RepID=A0AAW2GYT2_9HYME
MDDSLQVKSSENFVKRLTKNSTKPQKPQKSLKHQEHTCNLCGNKYSTPSSLRRHQLQCGNKEATLHCNFCPKKFYRRDRLKEHLSNHYIRNDPNFSFKRKNPF